MSFREQDCRETLENISKETLIDMLVDIHRERASEAEWKAKVPFTPEFTFPFVIFKEEEADLIRKMAREASEALARKVPHLCPVCDGRELKYSTKCPACNGTKIVWG